MLGARREDEMLEIRESPEVPLSGPVLVTGGGGFLGLALLRRLAAGGLDLRSFSRALYPELDELGVNQLTGDLADPEAVQAAVRGCRIVFHVAAKAGIWGEAEAFYRTNVEGTRNVVEACLKEDCRRLIYTSSPSVVFRGGDLEGVDESLPLASAFTSDYPRTKARAERETLQAAGPELKVVALRPHLIWGPGDRHILPGLVARANSGQLRRLGTSPCLVDFTYIDNAVEAHVLAATALGRKPELSGRVYFISDDEPVPLWEFIGRMLAIADTPPVERSIPTGVAQLAGGVLETVYRILRLSGEPRITRFLAEQLSTSHWFDISAAKRDLGYRPVVGIDEGMKRLGEWLSRNRKAPTNS